MKFRQYDLNMPNEPQILVISFSDISVDSRVLREISVVEKHGHVTTLGYGPKPRYGHVHLQVPDKDKSLPQTIPGVLKLGLRLHKAAALAAPGNKAALRLLEGRTFDAVVANDARSLPLAFEVARRNGAPVWGDMHEFAPEERTHVTSWRMLVKPFMDWICRTYLPECKATTTVSNEFAKLYKAHYGIDPRIVMNASFFKDLEPSPMPEDGTIRLVHGGGAVYGRNIEGMIEAVKTIGNPLTLDLYLVPGGDGGAYLGKLKEIAGDDPRIRIHPPVKPQELLATLNHYDVGIHWLPPYSANAIYTLPNKIFEYVQARLAVAIGPTKEMVNLVDKYHFGLVSNGFTQQDILDTLRELNVENVREFKTAAHAAARDLSYETSAQVIDEVMEALLLGKAAK